MSSDFAAPFMICSYKIVFFFGKCTPVVLVLFHEVELNFPYTIPLVLVIC